MIADLKPHTEYKDSGLLGYKIVKILGFPGWRLNTS